MDLQQEIVNAFQVEHKEQVEGIRSILASLEQQVPAPRDPRWDEAFRMAHTLKGGARVCSLHGVEALGHRMESLFACVREGSLGFDAKVADTIYHALDAIEDWMTTFTAGQTPASPAETLDSIEQLLRQAKAAADIPIQNELPAPPASAAVEAPAERAGAPSPPTELESLRVQTQHLDAVLRSSEALFAVNADHDHLSHEMARLMGRIHDLQRECEAMRSASGAALRRLNAIPEFADVARNVDTIAQRMRQIVRQGRTVRTAQQRGAWMTRTASDDLRRAVRQTRMIAAENVLQGLRAVVRNLARDEGKEIEFRTVGLNVHADRMVLQAIKDPLLHVMRNAVVHGIESPEDRQAAGKSRTGQIQLTLTTRGNRLCVLVEDDGRGIDLDRVAREAVKRGFMQGTALEAEPNREQLWRVLFKPGFSTATTITELAGRGMGLSVVNETIARLGGSVRLGPRAGGGAVLEMVVPLIVSAERLLMVACAGQTYAIPVHAVERLLRLKDAAVQTIDGRNIVITDDAPFSLVRLSTVLGCEDADAPVDGDELSIVAIRSSMCRIGLVVDAFLGEREALIKSLDGAAAEVGRFSGAILLDDSQVVLVIDPMVLADSAAVSAPLTRNTGARPKEQIIKTPTILVVDDSFTTRTLEKSILETNGYDVRVAVDGVEALTVLRSEPIDIVIADVQMPRMDGLSLLKNIRDDAKFRDLPLILVTSLDEESDRQRGLDLGANAYIVKRKFDHQELLGTIQHFL